MSITLIDPADEARSCTDLLSVPAASAEERCPVGTSLQTHSQASTVPWVPVFKYSECAPCATGHLCPTGASAECPAGTFTELLGASTCLACPNGTVSLPGAAPPLAAGGDAVLPCRLLPLLLPLWSSFWRCQLEPAFRSCCWHALPGIQRTPPLPAPFHPQPHPHPRCPPPHAGSETCQERDAGTTPNAERNWCELCPAGTFSTAPGSECRQCAPGSYRSDGGGDGKQCTACPPGSATPLWGQAECQPCAPGHAQGGEGATACRAW